MKQTFVVPIYQYDPVNYITKIVRAPLNSKRIDRVWIQSLGERKTFYDHDLIGISVNDVNILPKNFPASFINSCFSEMLEGSFNTILPRSKSIEINSECAGSEVKIEYLFSKADVAIVFECDDEPIEGTPSYHVENYRPSLNDWNAFAFKRPTFTLNINLPSPPISLILRPTWVGSFPSSLNEPYVVVGVETRLTFLQFLMASWFNIQSDSKLLISGNMAVFSTFPLISNSNAWTRINATTKNISGFINIRPLLAAETLEQLPAFAFDTAGFQLIFKTTKQ